MTEGRDNRGRFTPGNKAASADKRPYTRKAAELRRALYNAVTASDIARIVETLKAQALEGNLKASALLLDRILGTAQQGIDLLERLEKLEAVAESRAEGDTDPDKNDQ